MQRISLTIFIALALLSSTIPAATAAPPAVGGYIVVLHDNVDSPAAAAREITGQVGGRVGHIYKHALKGFSITLPPQAVAALKKNPKVKYVATDDIRYAFAQTVSTGIQRIFADTNANIDIDATDDYRVDVDVAVIDTGVDFEHSDLNVVGGVDCSVSFPFFPDSCVEGGDDDHYHGTHVAGTIGAIDNGSGVVGVAPGARIWAVKVLDNRGSGWSSWIVAGIDWVTANAGIIEVANMSLGGSGWNQAEYEAIEGAVNAGVAFAVAAGNSDDNANNYSPAAFDNVLTVSALADFDGRPGGLGSYTCRTDRDDTLADFSNWGNAVQIAAPGVCILSTFPLEQGEYGTISGTSMASPHAAGALALLASTNNPSNATDVYNLYNQVIYAGNFDWTDDSGDGIQEPLLDVSTFTPVLIPGGGGGGGGSGCNGNADCDNGLFCDGAETCVEGNCQAGTPPDCDDEVPCTVDTCDEVANTCVYAPNDGNCDDNNLCTDDNCDPSEGCIYTLINFTCTACFKGKCDGKCSPSEKGSDCADCAPSSCSSTPPPPSCGAWNAKCSTDADCCSGLACTKNGRCR